MADTFPCRCARSLPAISFSILIRLRKPPSRFVFRRGKSRARFFLRRQNCKEHSAPRQWKRSQSPSVQAEKHRIWLNATPKKKRRHSEDGRRANFEIGLKTEARGTFEPAVSRRWYARLVQCRLDIDISSRPQMGCPRWPRRPLRKALSVGLSRELG